MSYVQLMQQSHYYVLLRIITYYYTSINTLLQIHCFVLFNHYYVIITILLKIAE